MISTITLTACVATPVARHFPDAPQELKTSCQKLQTVEPGTTKLSEVVSTVASNYGQYHECQLKTESWIEWYNIQKQLFDSVK